MTDVFTIRTKPTNSKIREEHELETKRAATLDWDSSEEHYHREILLDRLEAAETKLAAKQAMIDMLMLEYCPEEMNAEQMAEWAKHQRPENEEE